MLGAMRVLVLGGTTEGREVAAALTAAGHDVTVSVAGRTAQARTPASGLVSGGFGGAAGLADHLRTHRIDALVDATHPFAATMSRHAASAAASTGTPLVRLERPGWGDRPDADTWTWVPDHDAAARAASGRGRVLLTVGRQPLSHYAALPDVIARVAEAPDAAPPGWTILVDRGPFAAASERALFAERAVRVLVTKDAGGDATAAKLDVAAELGIAVVMVRRPDAPDVPRVATVADVTHWLAARRG